MTPKGMSDKANKNRDAIADIRRRMLLGVITHEQAKVEAKPIIDEMNARAKDIAKEHGMRFKPITFVNLMR